MPQDLLNKCKPLHCELCSCQATSPMQARMHYEGELENLHEKLHKNLHEFLRENSHENV